MRSIEEKRNTSENDKTIRKRTKASFLAPSKYRTRRMVFEPFAVMFAARKREHGKNNGKNVKRKIYKIAFPKLNDVYAYVECCVLLLFLFVFEYLHAANTQESNSNNNSRNRSTSRRDFQNFYLFTRPLSPDLSLSLSIFPDDVKYADTHIKIYTV